VLVLPDGGRITPPVSASASQPASPVQVVHPAWVGLLPATV
jgi:hypothetical protein